MLCWGSYLTPTVMPIHFGTPMDENPFGADPIVIFTATYELMNDPLGVGYQADPTKTLE